jgi:hypothetical protein
MVLLLQGQFVITTCRFACLSSCTQLFMVVNVRGGYEAVCVSFRWQDICRCLGCDQSPQTITNMRIAYERSLLEFEQYVRCGRYQQDRVRDHPPQWVKGDTDSALEQCRRAGQAAAQQPAPGTGSAAPRPAAVGPRGALPLGAGAAGLMGLQGVQLMQGNAALAQAQLAARLQLQQQAQLLAAQKAGRPLGPAGTGPTRPAQAGQPQVINAAVQQQLLMLQRAQLLQQAGANNPQLALLLQQQQQQQAQLAAAAAAAGNARPLGTAAAAAPGVLTVAQLQQLQQLQQQRANAAAAAAAASQQGAGVAAGGGAGASAGAVQGQPAASQALGTAGSVNYSAMLDGL